MVDSAVVATNTVAVRRRCCSLVVAGACAVVGVADASGSVASLVVACWLFMFVVSAAIAVVAPRGGLRQPLMKYPHLKLNPFRTFVPREKVRISLIFMEYTNVVDFQ